METGGGKKVISFEQLRREKKRDPIAAFEQLLRDALASLLPDLAACPWYVREREVVNLFVFQHPIPRFQGEDLDITQIGIEIPVLKRHNPKPAALSPITQKQPRETVGRYADIVVWPHTLASRARTCRPLIQIEWKNISSKENNGSDLERGHEKDIRILKRDRDFVCASYAVLTDQRNTCAEVRCTKISLSGDAEDFFSQPYKASRVGVEAYKRSRPNGGYVWCLKCEGTYNQKMLADVPDYEHLPLAAQGSVLHKEQEGCDPRWLTTIAGTH